MNVRAQWIAVLLIGLLLGGAGAACSSTTEDDLGESDRDGGDGDGDGDTGDGDGDNGDGDGDTGDGDGDVNTGDGDGDGDTGDGDGDTGDDDGGAVEGITCGSAICAEEGGCCSDPFQSMCGAAIGERGCIKPPEPDENSDPRCPEISIPGIFVLPSCCVEGMCGVSAMGLGAPTPCSELGMFKMAVDERTGGMAPFAIPAPQACD